MPIVKHTVTARIDQINYTTRIEYADHQLLADEPKDFGGQDEGFAPMELLLSSLAACSGITLRMYAQRKEWQLDSVELELTLERDAASGNTQIVRKIRFTGNLNEEQRQRLLQIANQCPVHKTLTNPIKIETMEY